MEELPCLKCGTPSGTSLVCRNCRHDLTDSEKKEFIIVWHEIIVARSFDPKRNKHQCHHCQLWFVREKVCGDHFPHTKGARPDLRFDILNGVTSCAGCNTSGSKHRSISTGRKGGCLHCRILTPLANGYCVQHQCYSSPKKTSEPSPRIQEDST